MAKALGVGGIFFKSKDPQALMTWYQTHLGLPTDAPDHAAFSWQSPENPTGAGTTLWTPFKESTTYFGGSASFMVNFRVHDLKALIAALRAEGCKVDDKVDESEYGKFGWVIDPDGNKVELWEPPAGQ